MRLLPKPAAWSAAALFAVLSASANAGPPFLTDDPEPTGKGHWEIYGPFIEVDGRGAAFSGASGVEINYGAARDVQVTLALPLAFAHDTAGWQSGGGDIEGSVKLRLLNDSHSHVQLAVFPGLSLPTAHGGLGAGRVTALLPVWLQHDHGVWSVFGGGGYAINPGPGRHNYWTGGLAVSRAMTEHLLIGVEATRHGADEIGGGGQTSFGIGAIRKLRGPLRLLASGGPTFDDGEPAAGYHAFLALGLDF